MIDLGTGNNNKINWAMNDKQEFIDIVETVRSWVVRALLLPHFHQLDPSPLLPGVPRGAQGPRSGGVTQGLQHKVGRPCCSLAARHEAGCSPQLLSCLASPCAALQVPVLACLLL